MRAQQKWMGFAGIWGLALLAACSSDSTPAEDTGDAEASGDASTDTGGAPDTDPPLPVDEPPVAASACTTVQVPRTAGYRGPWEVRGEVAVIPTIDAAGVVSFRAPAVAFSTRLELVSTATGATFPVDVTPATPDPAWVPGLAADCAPFIYGVASGDPTSRSVLLWTWIETSAGAVTLDWQVSLSPTFDTIAVAGRADARAEADGTVVVEASGLAPGTDYWYRFVAPDGATSRVGRTRTAPEGSVEQVRFALASCSSLWSGWFTAYRRLALRGDVDLVIHLGDYIYDSVDPDEEERVPVPRPETPDTLEEHRDRHRYYLLDPDLRAARAAYPWFVIWDNHDLLREPPYGGGVQAFREYVPMRVTDPTRPEIAWRTLRYGDLLDVSIMDILLFRNLDTLPDSEAPSMLGTEQYTWLTGTLSDSTATWQFVGGQKLLAPFDAPIEIGGSTWASYPEARQQLTGYLRENEIRNVVFLSGDAHMTFVADVTDSVSEDYQPGAGDASAAVEFLAGSITRGNVDESLDNPGPELMDTLTQGFLTLNPHFAHTDLQNHGYGIVDITSEQVTVEMWFSDRLDRTAPERFDRGVVVEAGNTWWNRTLMTEPTVRRR